MLTNKKSTDLNEGSEIRVTSLKDKMRENLNGSGMWRGDAPVQRYERLDMNGYKRGRDGMKKYWKEVIRQNITHV